MTKQERRKQFHAKCKEYGFEKVNAHTYVISDGRWIDNRQIVIHTDDDYSVATAHLLVYGLGYDNDFKGERLYWTFVDYEPYLDKMFKDAMKKLKGGN